MTLPPIETVNGQDFGRCAVCKGRTSVERGGRRCFCCERYGGPATRKARLLAVLAATNGGR